MPRGETAGHVRVQRLRPRGRLSPGSPRSAGTRGSDSPGRCWCSSPSALGRTSWIPTQDLRRLESESRLLLLISQSVREAGSYESRPLNPHRPPLRLRMHPRLRLKKPPAGRAQTDILVFHSRLAMPSAHGGPFRSTPVPARNVFPPACGDSHSDAALLARLCGRYLTAAQPPLPALASRLLTGSGISPLSVGADLAQCPLGGQGGSS